MPVLNEPLPELAKAQPSPLQTTTLLVGIGLSSFSALLLELALTRLFSVLFARESARIPRMYGADLFGGALACLAVVPLLNWMGAPNAVLFSALASAAAAAVWSASRAR